MATDGGKPLLATSGVLAGLASQPRPCVGDFFPSTVLAPLFKDFPGSSFEVFLARPQARLLY